MADPYRATRQFERFLGYRGRNCLPPSEMPASEEKGKVIAIITYRREADGSLSETIVRPGDLERKVEP